MLRATVLVRVSCMGYMLGCAWLAGAAGLSSEAAAAPLTQEEKESDLKQLGSLVKSQYGPYEFKKINVEKLLERYVEDAKKIEGNLDYYYLLNRFVGEFNDSHFRAQIKTTHVSTLGFVADLIGGKVLLDSIDRRKLPPPLFPVQSGDEIVEFDGKPVMDAVKELGRYFGAGYEGTRLRMAAQLLGHRSANTVPPQKGTVQVKIKSVLAEEPVVVTLPWRQEGEELEELPLRWGRNAPTDYLQLAVNDVYEGFPQVGRGYAFPEVEKGYRCSGLTRINPPEGAEVLMIRPFVAYTHPTPRGPVGYLRIPHYSWGKDAAVRLRQYEYIVDQLERKTVGLVIDQDHNCGGSVTFLEDMVALFVDKPFSGLQFQFLASRNEFLTFKNFVDDDERQTLAGQDALHVLNVIKTAWLAGKKMTPLTTFHGTRLKQPSAVRYTHPVLVLIDELSGSGGDAFPAMLQGMKRARLFGTRTMGAGGHVVEAGQLNYSGTSVRLTKSLFFHPNGTAIENNGAVPDVPYTPTKEDFMEGYQVYQKAYLAELGKMIDDAKKPPAVMPRAVD